MTPILVVDDSTVIVRLLTLALRQGGYDVTSATDGDEALAQIKQIGPPLVFLDAMMPKRDGYDVCQEVRADGTLAQQPYVIMLTAGAQEADRQRAEAVGVDEFMTKPFSPSQLLARVGEVLGAPS